MKDLVDFLFFYLFLNLLLFPHELIGWLPELLQMNDLVDF